MGVLIVRSFEVDMVQIPIVYVNKGLTILPCQLSCSFFLSAHSVSGVTKKICKNICKKFAKICKSVLLYLLAVSLLFE